MTNPAEDLLGYWRHCASEAKAGRFYLDPELATIYRDAATELITTLRSVRETMRTDARVGDLGDFDSARQVEKFLNELATGPNGAVAYLDENIDIARAMVETMNCSIGKQVATDEQTGTTLGGINAPNL